MAVSLADKPKITPCLFFNMNAEEAVKFYMSIFKDSQILATTRYPKGSPAPEGSVMTIVFKLDGQVFMALNGGADFKFTEAISMMAKCDTQEELDEKWKKLSSDGGREVQCGWVQDKYGLYWQIIPTMLAEMFKEGNPERIGRVVKAVWKMVKIDIKTIKEAYEGVEIK